MIKTFVSAILAGMCVGFGGIEHCIADMFYFRMAGAWSGRAAVCILTITLGNVVGGVVFPLLRSFLKHEFVRVG